MQNNLRHKPKARIKALLLCLLITGVITTTAFIYTQNVPKTITSEDIRYIAKILEQSGIEQGTMKETAQRSFTDEIYTIRAVQNSAFVTAPKVRLIPKGTPREPQNLYKTDAAYCGDRARYIDKALRHLGFKTRYASLYLNQKERGFISTMLTKSSLDGVDSHALVEVLTSKGWLIVDTRRRWISLTAALQPISLETLSTRKLEDFQWSNNKEESWPLLDENYYIIYELYSRHGLFYPPYTKYVPDIHWPDFFKHNLNQL